MTLSAFRRALYRGARLAGDLQAAKRGRLPQRLANRAIGRGVARIMRGVWR